jgi:hypothetical protein
MKLQPALLMAAIAVSVPGYLYYRQDIYALIRRFYKERKG